jgi:hypothetical protein
MMPNYPGSSEEFLKRNVGRTPSGHAASREPAPRVFRMPKGKIALDSIIVVPKIPARKSKGGIEYPGRSRAAELANTTVGQVIDIGPLAYTTVTRDGLDFTKAARAAVGDWIIYTRNAGQTTLLREEGVEFNKDMTDCPRFLILSDADIKYIFESKEEADLVWSWVR